MSKNFVEIKDKNIRARWLKSTLFGLGIGSIAGGVFLALSKLGILSMKPIWSLPIGLGSTALAWGLVWLVLLRTDRALAKKLDRKFGLQERVQTMLEYEKEEGAMFALQRADTEASLGTIPKKKLRVKRIWIYALSFVLGVATLTTAILIKPKEVSAEPGQTPVVFKLEEWQRVGLTVLIRTVEESEVESLYRENVVQTLNDLLAELEVADEECEMEASVSSAIEEILLEMDNASWVIEFTETLWNGGNQNVRKLVKAINCYEWELNKEWTTYTEGITNFINSFRHEDESKEASDEGKIVSETASILSLASANLSEGLGTFLTVYGLEESDPLYAVFTKLNNLGNVALLESDGLEGVYGLSTLAAQFEALGETGTLNDYKALFEGKAKLVKLTDALKKEIYDVLTSQYINTTVGKNTITEICRLFSYEKPRFDAPNLVEEEDSGGDDQPSIIPPGGNTPESAYGGDEWILDYTKNEQVKYGDVFLGYEAEALEKAREENSPYTEEEKQAIERYFDILRNGFGKEEGETNE